MRVSPRELKAVRAGGLVSRYAVLGDAVFVVADLPDAGTAGTAAEEPCRLEHWGLVLQGEVTLVGRRGRTFEAGTAFYIAPGPTHRFRAEARAVIAGFAPVTEPIDDSPETLSARGVEVLTTLERAAAAPDRDAHRRAPEPHRGRRRDRDRVGRHGRLAVHALHIRVDRAATRNRGATSPTGASCWTAASSSTGRTVSSSSSARATSSTARPGRSATGSRSPTARRSSTTRRSASSMTRPCVARRARSTRTRSEASARDGEPVRPVSARSRSRTAPPPPDAARVASPLQGAPGRTRLRATGRPDAHGWSHRSLIRPEGNP